MTIESEKQFKEYIEKDGWKVYKILNHSELNSECVWKHGIWNKIYSLVSEIENSIGRVGLPDFYVFKEGDKIKDGFFVEVKYKAKITEEQKYKIKKLKELTNLNTYIVNINKLLNERLEEDKNGLDKNNV